MRTTVALDDDLVRKAQEYTGLTEKSARLLSPDPSRVFAAAGGFCRHDAGPPGYSAAASGRAVVLADTSYLPACCGPLESQFGELRLLLSQVAESRPGAPSYFFQ